MGKVAKEQAEKEINGWLDYKKIGTSKREALKENIETLVEAVAEGQLVVNTDFNLVYTLKFETEGAEPVKELKFKPRLKVKELNKALTGVKATDADARLVAYAAAMSDMPKAIFEGLDTADYSFVQALVVFFL